MNKLMQSLYSVKDRESFTEFVDVLNNELANGSYEWNNNNLPSYLDAIQSYTEDLDGFYKNLKQPEFKDYFTEMRSSYKSHDPEKLLEEMPGFIWRIFADILIGSANYE